MSDLRETAKFIDAGEFIKWMHNRFGEQDLTERIGMHGSDRYSRLWYRWRFEATTGLICVYKVDEFLTKVFRGDVMLSDLPDSCFTQAERTWSRRSDEVKREAFSMFSRGAPPIEIAMELGISPSTVHEWRRSRAA